MNRLGHDGKLHDYDSKTQSRQDQIKKAAWFGRSISLETYIPKEIQKLAEGA